MITGLPVCWYWSFFSSLFDKLSKVLVFSDTHLLILFVLVCFSEFLSILVPKSVLFSDSVVALGELFCFSEKGKFWCYLVVFAS